MVLLGQRGPSSALTLFSSVEPTAGREDGHREMPLVPHLCFRPIDEPRARLQWPEYRPDPGPPDRPSSQRFPRRWCGPTPKAEIESLKGAPAFHLPAAHLG